tara:strand:- start:851 stop:1939 length:1089 start_codon:yes stop_codon:yes gene_type:complete
LVILASAADNKSREERLSQIEQEILQIDRWFLEQNKLKESWSTDLEKADLEIQNIKRKIFSSNKKLELSNNLLTKLKKERSNLNTEHENLSASLSKHLRSAYKIQKSPPLKRLLEGESINQFDRMMRYNRYLTTATQNMLEDFQNSITDIEANDRLAQIANTQIRESLLENEKSLIVLTQTISRRKNLIRDLELEQQGKNLVYQNLLAERQELEEVIKKILATKSRDDFGTLLESKNSLPRPIDGKISKNFGEKKENDTLTFQGLQISASAGTPVHAIFPGQIVFSDWLRGFGLLIIIDHGREYMSLYGNTEALYKTQGELVESGEIIAESGNSGGQEEAGIYFEIRYRGQPIDPEPWLKIE